jgi:hypothetical protein
VNDEKLYRLCPTVPFIMPNIKGERKQILAENPLYLGFIGKSIFRLVPLSSSGTLKYGLLL